MELSEKFGVDCAAKTVSESVVEEYIDPGWPSTNNAPIPPLMVMVYVPAGAELSAIRVSVLVPAVKFGVKDAETP